MPTQNSLQKISELINSEGMILGLFKDGKESLYLKSFVKPGNGYITYRVNKDALIKFRDNKYTIEDLLTESTSTMISYEHRNSSQTFVKDDFYGKLHCGNNKISDFSEGVIGDLSYLD